MGNEFKTVQTLFNTALPEKGANLTSPVSGAIVRWRIQDPEGGPFFLRVLRPNGSGAYTAVGTSNGTDKAAVAEAVGASYGFVFPPPFDNATVAPSGSEAGKEILVPQAPPGARPERVD